MTFVMEESVEIDAPITEVFAWMQAHDEWRMPYVRTVHALTDGPMRVGSRYENVIKAGGLTNKIVNEITALDPPHRMSWKQVSGSGPVVTEQGNYILEDLGTGRTRATVRNILRPRGYGRLLTPMLKWMTGRMGTRLMPQLKRGIESDTT